MKSGFDDEKTEPIKSKDVQLVCVALNLTESMLFLNRVVSVIIFKPVSHVPLLPDVAPHGSFEY